MVVLKLLLAGLLAFALQRAWSRWRRLRWVIDTPTARIRSAPQGYVELKGRARPMEGEPVIAPLSGLPCAWYRYRLEENRHNRWWPVDRGESQALFWLEDDTGRTAVDPEGAEVIKVRQDVWYDQGGGGTGARERYTEQRILPGESLYVLGLFTTVAGTTTPADLNRETALLLEQWKQDPRRMALFDRRGNGRIDPDEWEAARRAARLQARRKLQQQALEPDVHLLRHSGDPARPLVISTLSDRQLARRYRWQVAGWLGMALMMAIGLIKS